jgi:hypothetical protein
MEFHDVRHPDQAQPGRFDPHAPPDENFPLSLMAFIMRLFMHEAALGRKEILSPELLNMDQRALTLTEHQMLQRG